MDGLDGGAEVFALTKKQKLIDRLLLQIVGDGYIFIHRLLLEHFAQMR